MRSRTPLRWAFALLVGLLLCVALALGARCDDRPTPDAPLPDRVSLDDAFTRLGDREARVDLALLDDAPRSYALRWRMLEEAQRSLDVAYFILHDDCFGLAFVGKLYERALAGVDVRLLVDARGSKPLVSAFGGRALLQTLVASGNATVHVYNPPLETLDRALVELSPLLPAARSHLKVIVRDGEEGVVGGRNIAADYFATPEELATVAYDVDVSVASAKVSRALTAAFESDYEAPYNQAIDAPAVEVMSHRGEELLLYAAAMDAWLGGALGPLAAVADPAAALEQAASSRLPVSPSSATLVAARPVLAEMTRYRGVYGTLGGAHERLAGARADDVRARVLYDDSRASDVDRELWRGVLSVLRAAEREVHIESPYLVLSEDGLAVLEELAERGVVVHLYTNGPRSSDNDLSQALFIEAWPEILARVPTLRLHVSDGEQLMHAKRLVVDGRLTLIGTYNLDLLSALVNSEVMLAVWDERFAKENVERMTARRELPHVRRYRIARDVDGVPLRHPKGHPEAGRIVVVYGPQHHTPPEQLEDLLFLRDVVTRFDHFAELEPAVW